MKFSLIIPALAAVAVAKPAIDPEIVDYINSIDTTWVAHSSARFENATLDQVASLCGTVMKGEPHYYELPESTEQLQVQAIPSDFDSRTNWGSCAGVIGHIRDQSACGSCWAFGSTEALNDRMCISSGMTTLLSPEDTTACCGFLQCFSMGCNGGQPSGAWSWFTKTGVVTGGDYSDIGSGSSCLPYEFEACAHHVAPGKYPACPTSDYKTPSCKKSCSESGYGTAYGDDKKKASSSYSLGSVTKIQQDIMTYGPVTAAFTVYADFPTYKTGVYQHKTGSALGGHAIKIIGWGVEDGTDYWLVNNSWNESWGDNGTFKILRGSNHCGIEGQVVAGQV